MFLSPPPPKIPVDIPIKVDTDTMVLIIEQFLMLILIIGRWMLPKVMKIKAAKFCIQSFVIWFGGWGLDSLDKL